MQEASALLPKLVLMFLGSATASLADIFTCLLAITVVERTGLWAERMKPPTGNSVVIRLSHIPNPDTERKVPLLDRLAELRGLEATDPRNIICAAFGIVDRVDKGAFELNYGMTVTEAYRSIAMYFMRDTKVPP